MIETSQTYKDLFNAGAIQEYRIEINGTLYDGDVVYDNVKLDGKLFDKETFTIGSFVASVLETKLNLTSASIPPNANVVFFYRYTDGTIHSEWIQKFEGRIANRTIHNDVVTNIKAYDKSVNYDVFLDVITDIPSYPANARSTAEKCAAHLGLELVNVADIINENIVEYPNELTVVQVLQRIAASSGGNFTILENGKLKLVVSERENLIPCDDFSCFNPYQGAEVTRNKTFPDNWFKGGKNLILNSGFNNGRLLWQNNGQCDREVVSINGENWIKLSTDNLDTFRGVQQAVSPHIKDRDITVSFDVFKETESSGGARVIVQQHGGSTGNNPQINHYFYDIGTVPERVHFTFRSTSEDKTNFSFILLGQSLTPFSIFIKDVKVEINPGPTAWSPAPEDGYANGVTPYLGDDFGTHIQTSGGTGTTKLFWQFQATQEETYAISTNIHAFMELRVQDGRGATGREIYLGGTGGKYSTISTRSSGNVGIQFTVNSQTTDAPLDFIASDASIIANPPATYQSTSVSLDANLEAISKVQAYWTDEAAFEAGDDTGTMLVNDNPWATQSSTNYVLSKLKGFKYVASSTTKTRLDPAYQLGDTFRNDDGTMQYVSSIRWVFDGSCIASVTTPISTSDNLDDPIQILNDQALKRKVSLGQSYQGVSIGREDGIQMLLSPDGSEANAEGKFYADLTKGMAFQYRDLPTDPWVDWLYFDKNEKIFKLNLYSTTEDVSSMIQLSNQQVHYGNIINNLNGISWYAEWTGGSEALYVLENLDPPVDIKFQNLKYDIGFVFMDDPTSLNGRKMSMYNNGYDISPKGFIANDGNIQYSYRAKVVKFKPFNIEVLEYNTIAGAVAKRTRFTFNSQLSYIDFTLNLATSTRYVALQFNRTGVSPSDRIELSEQMFNRGMPKGWFENASDVQMWAQSQINVLSNEIELKVDVDGVISAINLTSEQAKIQAQHIALEGITTINELFKVNLDGSIEGTDATFINATITGNLNAGTFANMNFDSTGVTFPNGKLKLNSLDNSIDFGTVKMIHSTKTINALTFDVSQIVNTKFFSFNGNSIINTNGIGSETGTLTLSGMSVMDLGGSYIQIGNTEIDLGGLVNIQSVLRPMVSGTTDLGTAALRFRTAYLSNQPNVSSDARYKLNVQDIDPLLIEIIGENVVPRMYNSNYDEKLHFGYIAQDVEAAFYKYLYKLRRIEGHEMYEASRLAQKDIEEFALLDKGVYMSLLYGELNVIMEAYNRMQNKKLLDLIKGGTQNE